MQPLSRRNSFSDLRDLKKSSSSNSERRQSIDLTKPQYHYNPSEADPSSLPEKTERQRSHSISERELPILHAKEAERSTNAFNALLDTYQARYEQDDRLKDLTEKRKEAKGKYKTANKNFQESFHNLDQLYQTQATPIIEKLQAKEKELTESITGLKSSKDSKIAELQNLTIEKETLEQRVSDIDKDVIHEKKDGLEKLRQRRDTLLANKDTLLANNKLVNMREPLKLLLASEDSMYLEGDHSENIEKCMKSLRNGQEVLIQKDGYYNGFGDFEKAYKELKETIEMENRAKSVLQEIENASTYLEMMDKARIMENKTNEALEKCDKSKEPTKYEEFLAKKKEMEWFLREKGEREKEIRDTPTLFDPEIKKQVQEDFNLLQNDRGTGIKFIIDQLNQLQKEIQELPTDTELFSEKGWKKRFKKLNQSIENHEQTFANEIEVQRQAAQASLTKTEKQISAAQDSLAQTETKITETRAAADNTTMQISEIEGAIKEHKQKAEQILNGSNSNPSDLFADIIIKNLRGFKESLQSLKTFIRDDDFKLFEASFQREYNQCTQDRINTIMKYTLYKDKRSAAIKRKAAILIDSLYESSQSEETHSLVLDHLLAQQIQAEDE